MIIPVSKRAYRRGRGGFFKTLALAGAASLALTACGSSSGSDGGDEEATLSVASFLIDGTPNANMTNWFLDTVEEESDGRIQFDRFPNESLCDGPEIVECVSDGRADMGITVPGYTPDRFPLQDLAGLPFMTNDNGAMMQAFHTLSQENEPFAAESENLGMKSLGYWPAGALLLGTNEPIESMDGLQGLKIRATGDGLLSALNAANASPVALAAGEMYEAVERGTIDAVANNMDAPINYQLKEVLPYWIDTGYGHYTTIGMWIAQPTYDSLDPELQTIVDSVSERLNTGEGIQKFADVAAEQCDVMLESDDIETVMRWDDAEIAEFKEATGDEATEQWLQTAQNNGVEDPGAVLSRYEELLAEYESDGSESVAPLEECTERFADR